MIKEFNGFHYNETNVLSRSQMTKIVGAGPCGSTGCTATQITFMDDNPSIVTETDKDDGVEYSYTTESGTHKCCRIYA